MFALCTFLLLPCLSTAMSWLPLACPDSIRKAIYNGGYNRHGTSELKEIYSTLNRCSNTRILHLKLAQSGCVVRSDDKWNFDFQPGDQFPALHELHLDNYQFDEHLSYFQQQARDIWYDMRLLIADYTGLQALRPTPGSSGKATFPGANLVKWKAAMNWTELRDLDLENVSPVFFDLMKGELPILKSLKLGPSWRWACKGKSITDFVTQLNPLDRLALHGQTRDVNITQILDCHGDTLSTFEIREWEGANYPRPVLSLEQLKQISEKCKSLTRLTVDINRNGTWPFELLDALTANERLSTLELFFELGMEMHYTYDQSWNHPNKTRDYRQPIVDTYSSLEMFRHLRKFKKGVELQTLIIQLGDVGRDYGHVMRARSWGEGLSETYVCSVLDSKGQRKGEGVAWCEPRHSQRTFSPFEFDEDEDEDEKESHGNEEENEL